jgi:DNA-binding YbaB/EbfC family protein
LCESINLPNKIQPEASQEIPVFEGLKNLGNMANLLMQAQDVAEKMKSMRDELSKRRVQGSAGGGMVTCEMAGSLECVSCHIDPALMIADDREVLEDLLTAAINDALTKAKQLHMELMESMPGGLPFSMDAIDEAGPS